MHSLLLSVFRTHNPTWADIQTLMNVLLILEEWRWMRGAMELKLEKEHENVLGWESLLPEPEWNLDNTRHAERLQNYWSLVLHGIQNEDPKIENPSRIYEIRQKKNESPGDFFFEREYIRFSGNILI